MPLIATPCASCTFCKTIKGTTPMEARRSFPRCTSKVAIQRRGTDIVPTNVDCGAYEPVHGESIDGVGN